MVHKVPASLFEDQKLAAEEVDRDRGQDEAELGDGGGQAEVAVSVVEQPFRRGEGLPVSDVFR